MKYLKMYEDLNNIDYHLDEVKMIFFDYIDKYDMEELPEDLEEDDTSRPGIYYDIYVDVCFFKVASAASLRDNKEISLTIYCQSEWMPEHFINDKDFFDETGEEKNKYWKKFDKFIGELPKFRERLESAGYIIYYKLPKDLIEEGFLEIRISI